MNLQNYSIILCVFVYVKIATPSQFTFPFILNYLKKDNVQFCHFFTCWTKNENLKIMKTMSQNDVRTSFPKSEKTVNLALLEKSDLTSYGYILDLNCQKFRNSFLLQNVTRMRMNYPWLMFAKFSNSSTNIFENVSLRMDSNVKLVVPNEDDRAFDIFDVYNPGLQVGSKPIITKYGLWDGTKLTKSHNFSFYLQRKNMTFVKLRSGSVVLRKNHSGTFEEYISDRRHIGFDTMSKFHYPLFLLLENVHNFTHTVQIEDRWFGDYQNGTDGGVAKLLHENKIDITCTGATQRPPRIDAYDYLMRSYHFRVCYFFRNPGSYSLLSDEFLKPFSSGVWYITAISLVAISVFLKKFYRVESRFMRSTVKYSWFSALLTTLSVIFQQDASAFPTGNAGRVAFLVLQILSVLLYNYYTSSIISSFLNKPRDSFHTLDELGHSNLEIGVEDVPYTMTWFAIINDSDVQYIYRHKVFPPEASKPNFYVAEEGMEKVRKGGFAYHVHTHTGYPIIAETFDQDAICDITEITMIPQTEGGMMLQKNSQYKELFHITLRKMKEVGLVERVSQIWEAKKPECLSSAKAIAVGISQVFVAFLILFVGMVLSLVLLVAEIFWCKLNLDRNPLRKY